MAFRVLWARVAVLTALLCGCGLPATAAEPAAAGAVGLETHIMPVLVKHCLACHNGSQASGELDLSRHDALLKGGESGSPAVSPGKPADSYLLDRIVSGEMPPKGKGQPLSPDEIEQVQTWIAAGAEWPAGRIISPFEFTTDTRAGRDWWALRAPVRPAVPTVAAAAWVRSPLDAFVLQKLEAAKLMPSQDADRATLIRRAKFDLLGLPPTPAEVQAFVADNAPDAYEKLIDRLLASPQYGERWGRHWLDVVRFAESNGYETNTQRANAWPYRDYVIRAFNEDRPYPQFILEQLAGDQVGAPAGTGFLVGGSHDIVLSPDVELTLQQRLNDLDDMLSTTSNAFLGLTVGCAKCHDHKFDPIAQRDYYSMQAMFAGVQHGERSLAAPQTEEQKRESELARGQLAETEQKMQALLAAHEPLAAAVAANGQLPAGAVTRPAVHALGNVDRFAPVRARYVRFTVFAASAAEPCIDELEIYNTETAPRNVALASLGAKATASSVYGAGSQPIHQLAHINDGQYGNSKSWISAEPGAGWVQIELAEPTTIDRVAWARDRQGAFRDRVATRYQIEVAETPSDWHAVASSLDRRTADPAAPTPDRITPDQLPPAEAAEYQKLMAAANSYRDKLPTTGMAYLGTFSPAAPTYLLYRGEPLQKREEIAPASIGSVGKPLALPSTTPEAERRLALAKWIGDAGNPLTARVLVNRVWHHHFGQGLVKTPSDFGFNGGYASHPELLDWLACEFVDRGWSIKSLHKMIMLSSTYRQQSAHRGEPAAVDGGNRLLWRFSPRRLEAEPIRDSILWTAGTLDLRMGGPGYDAFEPNGNYVKVYTPREKFTPAEWRRMVYQSKPRMRQDGIFGEFDCPDSAQSLAKRNVSTTALQALNLLNGSFVVEQADRFAQRLEKEAGADVASQVQQAFWLAFGRAPQADESVAAQQLVSEAGLASLCRSLLNANEFVYVY